MIKKQKFDWDMLNVYVKSLPDHEHTELLGIDELMSCDDLYTFRFGEGDRDKNRPFGFPIASFRDKNGTLWISQTRYNHHTLCAATTGSGKTQGVVLNAAYNADARESYVIADPKGEVTRASYTRLCELFGKENVLILNILDPHHTTVFYNPLAMFAEQWLDAEHKKEKKIIRNRIVSDLKRLFEQLYPIESARDPSWERTARTFIMGVCLGLMEDLTLSDKESKRTGRVRTTPEMVNFETLRKVYDSFKWSGRASLQDGGFLSTRRKSSLAYTYTYSVINNADTTRSNYLGFVDLYLSRYSDPKILEISQHNTLKASTLAGKPHVLLLLYDVANEGNRDYLNMCVTQLITELLEKSHSEAKPLDIPIHFILDEFATLRPSNVYPNLLATGRGSGLFVHMIVQSRSQLKARYPEECETMMDNCDVQFYLGSNDLDTAKKFQEALGTTSAVDSEAFLRGDFLVNKDLPVVTLDPLLHRMKHGETYIKRNNGQPIHGQYSLYYQTPEYTAYLPTEMNEFLPPKGLKDVSYQLPKPTKDDLDFDLEEVEEIEGQDDDEEYTNPESLRVIIPWVEEPFEYERNNRTEYDEFAMDRIEEIVGISRNFSRQDIIELLKILKKVNTVEENNEMLGELLHQFEIATDIEYDKLKKQIFEDK